jgi:hypothetical protein
MQRSSVVLFLWAFLTPDVFGQLTVSAYLGKSHTPKAGVHVIRPPDTDVFFDGVSFEDRSFRRPLYYGIRSGYMVTPAAGIEAEFIHIKVFARVNEPVMASGRLPATGGITTTLAPATVLQQYNISHGLNLLLGNFVLKRELRPRLDLSFRAGLGMAIPHPEIRAFGQALDEYQRHGAAVQFAGGAEFELTRGLFWLGEYKFTNTSPRFEIESAAVENTFATHHVVTGIGFRF